MGWTIGMPSLKLNNTGAKSKHCGSFSAVAGEALEERNGRDIDIDRARSNDNIYTGFRTAAELQEYSKQHIAELSAKQVAAGGRKIRDDAVVMCATIIKPPAAMMNQMSEEQQLRFCSDALEKLGEIVGKDNVKSTAIHRDEQGIHIHTFWEPITPDGRLCAKEMHNLKFLGRLNKEMPEFLRSRGWDVADCKAYDQAQEALKSEQERAEERAMQGRSSASYKADAEHQKNKLLDEVDKLETVVKAKEEQLDELRRAKGPIGRLGPLRKENQDLQEQLRQANRNLEVAESEVVFYQNKVADLTIQIERQKELRSDLDMEIKYHNLEREHNALKRTFERYKELIARTLAKLPQEIQRAFTSIFKGLEAQDDRDTKKHGSKHHDIDGR